MAPSPTCGCEWIWSNFESVSSTTSSSLCRFPAERLNYWIKQSIKSPRYQLASVATNAQLRVLLEEDADAPYVLRGVIVALLTYDGCS
jgi:hypothetical protein